jgi:uncharacterized protein
MRILFLILMILVNLEVPGSADNKLNNTIQPISMDTLILEVPSDGVHLHVRIIKSSGQVTKSPAIIFLFGSGEFSTINNNSRMTGYFFDASLIDQGFVMVYFDKRGTGMSEGVWYKADFELRATDAKNVALAIRELDFVDADQVFVAGHSQGGWIVQIALAAYPDIFTGGISMAGPVFGVRRQLVNDYYSRYFCAGKSEEKALRKAERKVRRDMFFVSLLARRGNLKQLKIIKEFEPEIWIKGIHKPILLLFAENDPLVSPDWSLETIDKLFPEGIPDNLQIYITEGEEHSFKKAPPCYTGKWQDIPFSEDTRETMKNWLLQHTNFQ